MIKTRKLQFIGKQFLLNMPRGIIEDSQWQKGDYLSVIPRDKNTLEIRKVGTKDMKKEDVLISRTEQNILHTLQSLLTNAENMDPTDFSWNLSEITHQLGKLRKYRIANSKPDTK